jgi:hypothetical protein
MTDPVKEVEFEYFFALHSFEGTERAAKADAEIKQRAKDGWRVHSWSQEGGIWYHILWYRKAAAE